MAKYDFNDLKEVADGWVETFKDTYPYTDPYRDVLIVVCDYANDWVELDWSVGVDYRHVYETSDGKIVGEGEYKELCEKWLREDVKERLFSHYGLV